MKVMIVGSRSITNKEELSRAVTHSEFEITTVLSGGAEGVDALAWEWAGENNKGFHLFPAEWARYGKQAGVIRTRLMFEEAEAAIIIWDGKSKGTWHTIRMLTDEFTIPAFIRVKRS